jgi:uncharacterized membrane protein YoaK (UPF0700 family)
MTTELNHHTSGTLGMAVSLAAAAGFVDAFVYVTVTPVFVANMSGNLIHLGIAAGERSGHVVAAAAVALAGFLFGAIAATTHLDRRRRAGLPSTQTGLLVTESALIVLLMILVTAGGSAYSAVIRPFDYAVVVVGSVAMGCQAVALRRVGQIAVSTTYGTGAIVRLGEKVALALRRADRPSDARRRHTIGVLCAVLVGYVGGAWIATAMGDAPALLLIPAAVPLAAAFSVARSRRPEHHMPEDVDALA